MTQASFDGWAPIRVVRDADAWTVDWAWLRDQRFDEPFFEQTIGRALRRPFNQVFRRRTLLDDLAQPFDSGGRASPAGLIFHMSRCGSTLVAQMLASLAGSVVVSEANPVDEVLGASWHDAHATDPWREERLRWIVGALGRSVPGDRRRFVLKMDAWHVLDLPLIRRAFPGVPWIFVYRNPIEVLVSHGREMSWMMSAVNAGRLLGIDVATWAALPREEYHARVLERICAAVVGHDDPLGRMVNYSELPGAAMDAIPRWFGIEPSPDESRKLTIVARRDAKQPSADFANDEAEKQRLAEPAILAAAHARLTPMYAALEELRRMQGSASRRAGSEPAPLSSARLTLRKPVEGDAEELRAYFLRNAERFERWAQPHPQDSGEYAAWARARDAGAGSRDVVFLASEPGRPGLAGIVTLSAFQREEPPRASISYSIDAAYEGRGYASEAVSRVVAHARDDLKLRVLTAHYHPDNARSEKLLQRLGFTEIARTPVLAGFERLMRPHVFAQLQLR